MIQVYTSRHEDMNYAPIGLALRAVGHCFRVYIACFSDHKWMDGAHNASRLLQPYLTIEHSSEDHLSIRALFKKACSAILSRNYDMVILNGINGVCHKNIIKKEELSELINKIDEGIELVLSGPMADERLIEIADLVTDMQISKSENKNMDVTDKLTASVEIITGTGKGKTTYCLGKSLLMSSTGIRSLILQFIKSPRAYGEVMAIERLPFLDIKTMGEGFIFPKHGAIGQKHKDAARKAWEEGLKDISSNKYQLIVLDEINIAIYYGLIQPEQVKEMISIKPPGINLILSGRGAHPEVMKKAHRIIEMREVKHPFQRGISARKGIEY